MKIGDEYRPDAIGIGDFIKVGRRLQIFPASRREQVAMLVTGAVKPKTNKGNLKRLELQIPTADKF